ncbi:MAG: class I SAM-dependent methyltransferase [Singulisphaera sp.]
MGRHPDRIRRGGIRQILEIGCGPGQLAALLGEQGVTGYVGLDFSPQAIAMARENVLGARFVVGDARSPRVHDEVEHDSVICTEVLEDLGDDLRVVSGFRPGKRCFCSVPSFTDPSHVRHFRDAAEVVARYGPFFRDLDVASFASPRSDPHARYDFFLFDGVRNDHVIPES